MKDWKNYVLALIVLISVALLGCSTLVDALTPVRIPQRTAEYLQDPNSAGLSSLLTAKELRVDTIIRHRDINIQLIRLAQDDEYAYEDALGLLTINIDESERMQEIIIGDAEHPFSIIGMLGPTAGGILAGKELFKRKKDYTPEDHDADVAKAFDDGKAEAEKVS